MTLERFLLRAISRSFAGFTQWRTLAGTLSVLDQFGQVMHFKSQILLKYFKSEAKSLSRSS